MTSRVDPLPAVRLERSALRAERDRVGWWRRVVRARMDLVVAAAASPGPLGEDAAFVLPLDVLLDIPRPDALRAALPLATSGREITRLPELRALDAQLARYAEGIERALAGATSRLVERLAEDPGAALRGLAAGTDGH